MKSYTATLNHDADSDEGNDNREQRGPRDVPEQLPLGAEVDTRRLQPRERSNRDGHECDLDDARHGRERDNAEESEQDGLREVDHGERGHHGAVREVRKRVEAPPGRTLRAGQQRRSERDIRRLEDPAERAERPRHEGPESASDRVGAHEAAERDARAEQDGGGEVVTDGDEVLGMREEVEEEACVEALQQRVEAPEGGLHDLAEGVEAVGSLCRRAVQRQRIYAVTREDSAGGTRSAERRVAEVPPQVLQPVRVDACWVRRRIVQRDGTAALPPRDCRDGGEHVEIRQAPVHALVEEAEALERVPRVVEVQGVPDVRAQLVILQEVLETLEVSVADNGDDLERPVVLACTLA